MGLPNDNIYVNYRKKKSEIFNEKYGEIFQGYTGVVANYDTGKQGKHVAFRFDIDALKITECEGKCHIPFRENFQSKNHGYMHACGHDGHMAIGLAFAKFLIENNEKMKGKFTFIFQPAEEGVRGAKSMIASRFFPNPDYFFSLHLGFGLETGVVGVGTQGFLGSEHIEAVLWKRIPFG